MTDTETPETARGDTRAPELVLAGDDASAFGVESGESPPSPERVTLRERLSMGGGRLAEPREPLRGTNVLRGLLTLLLSVLCLLTVLGAILLLLLWQQQRDAGVLSTQLNRTWDLFDTLRSIERVVAIAAVPVGAAWIALASINVRRATGRRPSPVFGALSLPFGMAGVWFVGHELVEPAMDDVAAAAGFVLQAVFILVPLVALLRLAVAADARHRPMRAAAVLGIGLLAGIEFLGALSTIESDASPDDWGKLGAYLVIVALIQVLGTLAANEGGRAIEEGTEHRYQLRSRFGESLLAQAEV